ncbi:MAG: SRPBCC family protein [Ilumatobacteraceae bacterium]|jgi:carbon monoxide dehydrogenase subunit G|nr:SRPBCC family protein [Ilumatobacteraceae bacterium]
MEINNSFEVKAPIDVAWATLTDLARIAPCLPGATLTSVEGDIYKGHVTVKVGPIVAKFGGQAIFQERNDTEHRAVLKGDGRDSTGKGNASAIITAQLEVVDANTTRCTVTTDLTITGKIAQFGRGALADVSDKLLKQFVINLETTVLSQEISKTEVTTDLIVENKLVQNTLVENAPLNLLGSTGLSLALPILKRIAPVLILVAAVIAWFVTR